MRLFREQSKLTAIFTAILFCATQVFMTVPGLSQATIEVQDQKPQTEIEQSGFYLDLDQDLGTVQTLYSGTGATVVHLQTAHGNYDAQKKIQEILHFLKDEYGFKLLFLEGGAFKLRPERLKLFPTRMDITHDVLNRLMRKAYVKGPELFLMESPEAVGYGIEEVDNYVANGYALQRVLSQRKKTKRFLNQMDIQINRLTGAYVNKDLRAFLKQEERYEIKALPFMDWLRYLKAEAEENLDIHLSDPAYQMDWPMMLRVFVLESLSKKIDMRSLRLEAKSFIKEIEGMADADKEQIKRLLTQVKNNHQLPSPGTTLLFERMVRHLPKHFNYEAFPNVTQGIARLILQSEIEAERLMSEMHSLTKKLITTMTVSKVEQEILELLRDYWILKRLFALELTPNDYEDLLGRQVRPSEVLAKFLVLNQEGRIRQIRFQNIEAIDQLFDAAMEFYRLVKDRDHSMIENIVRKLEETGERKAVVVTGGFHAEPFKAFFTENQYSYAQIIPKISKLGGKEKYLEAVLAMQKTISAPLLTSTYESVPVLSYNRAEREALHVNSSHVEHVIRQTARRAIRELASKKKAASVPTDFETRHGPDKKLVRAETRADHSKEKRDFYGSGGAPAQQPAGAPAADAYGIGAATPPNAGAPAPVAGAYDGSAKSVPTELKVRHGPGNKLGRSETRPKKRAEKKNVIVPAIVGVVLAFAATHLIWKEIALNTQTGITLGTAWVVFTTLIQYPGKSARVFIATVIATLKTIFFLRNAVIYTLGYILYLPFLMAKLFLVAVIFARNLPYSITQPKKYGGLFLKIFVPDFLKAIAGEPLKQRRQTTRKPKAAAYETGKVLRQAGGGIASLISNLSPSNLAREFREGYSGNPSDQRGRSESRRDEDGEKPKVIIVAPEDILLPEQTTIAKPRPPTAARKAGAQVRKTAQVLASDQSKSQKAGHIAGVVGGRLVAGLFGLLQAPGAFVEGLNEDEDEKRSRAETRLNKTEGVDLPEPTREIFAPEVRTFKKIDKPFELQVTDLPYHVEILIRELTEKLIPTIHLDQMSVVQAVAILQKILGREIHSEHIRKGVEERVELSEEDVATLRSVFTTLMSHLSAEAKNTPRMVIDYRLALPVEREDVTLIDTHILATLLDKNLEYTFWFQADKKEVVDYELKVKQYAERHYGLMPENLKIEQAPVNVAHELNARMDEYNVPTGFISYDRSMTDRIGIRKGLLRVIGSHNQLKAGLAGLVTADWLLKEDLPFSMFVKIHRGEDLIANWSKLLIDLKARVAFLASA